MAETQHTSVLNEYARKDIENKARRLIRRAGFSRSDREDLEQELTLRLLERSALYDPSRASLNTFVVCVIRSGVANILRQEATKKRAAARFNTSLHAEHVPPPVVEPEQERNFARLEVREAVAGLAPELQSVCQRLMADPPSVVARELKVTSYQLQISIGHIRRHFARLGLKSF